MNNKFDNNYQILLLEQKFIKNCALISEWSWSDFIEKGKALLGFGPSEAQKAAEAAKQAAKNDPTGKIKKLSLEISDEQLKQAEELIKKNPQLLKQYNAIENIEDKKAFMFTLLSNAKKAEADKFKKPEGKAGQLYDLTEEVWDTEWAEKNWKQAMKKKCVIAINDSGKPTAISLAKFNKNPDSWIRKTRKNMPDDGFQDDIEDVLEKFKDEKQKEQILEFYKIYIEAIGDEKKANKTFCDNLKKHKRITIYRSKNKPAEAYAMDKVFADVEKYKKVALADSPNGEADIDAKHIDEKDLEAYNKKLTQILLAPPYKMDKDTLDRYIRQATEQNDIIVLKKEGEDTAKPKNQEAGQKKEQKKEQKKDSKLISENAIINEGLFSDFFKRIKKKIPKEVAEKYTVALIDKKEFAKNQEKYYQRIEKLHGKKKAGEESKNKLIEAVRKMWLDHNALATITEMARLSDERRNTTRTRQVQTSKGFMGFGEKWEDEKYHPHGNSWFTPGKYIMWDMKGNKLSEWQNYWHISKIFKDTEDRVNAFARFLNGNGKKDDPKTIPPHPKSYKEILEGIANDTTDNYLKSEYKKLLQPYIDKCDELISKCEKSFPLKDKSKI